MAAYNKINLEILWNHTTKNFQVKRGQCDSVIFLETFSFGSSKYLLDLPLSDTEFFCQVLDLSTQIYHSTSCLTGLICKGV